MEFVKKNWKYILGLAVVLALGFYIYTLENRLQAAEDERQKAVVLSEQQAANVNVLQNALDLNKQNAAMLAAFVAQAQQGHVQPVTNFTVTATAPAEAAQQVADRINAGDPTLPPAALEKTDNTIVTTQTLTDAEKLAIQKANAEKVAAGQTTVNEEYGVAVYKNNNYRNWYVGTGVGWHDGQVYVPVSLQRNFSKDSAVEIEGHVQDAKINGGEVKYKRAVNKLFLGLF